MLTLLHLLLLVLLLLLLLLLLLQPRSEATAKEAFCRRLLLWLCAGKPHPAPLNAGNNRRPGAFIPGMVTLR